MAVSGTQRFVIGGLGGLAPVIVLLTVIDLELVISQLTAAKAAGHVVKVVALFGIGGLVAYLHRSEKQLHKLFQIGLGAPALIAGVVATNTVGQTKSPDSMGKTAKAETGLSRNVPAPLGLLGFVEAARAQPAPTAKPKPPAVATVSKMFSPPEQSGVSQFVEGLTGIQPARRWYVIAGSYVRAEDAVRYANEMNSKIKEPGLRAEAYAPSDGKKYFGVVLGENLTSAEAVALRDRAIAAGYPADTYIKSFATLR